MKGAFIHVHTTHVFPKTLERWIRPKISYSELTLENHFSFLLCSLELCEGFTDHSLQNIYQKAASRLKQLHIAYVITDYPSSVFQEVFVKQFGFIIPAGNEIKRLLYWPIIESYFSEHNYSLIKTPMAIFMNYFDKYRLDFLEKMLAQSSHVTLVTDKKAALESYLDQAYESAGISVPLRDLENLPPCQILLLFDQPTNRISSSALDILSFASSKDTTLLFKNERIFPLLCGILSTLGDVETEFLLHCLISRPFPQNAVLVEHDGFYLEKVINHHKY